jgi:catechol 2,3-dioxygenase-like lactoylglutathione lyase family enzyme
LAPSLTRIGAITLFIDDVQRSKAFYEKAFDVQPVFEDADAVTFRFENTLVNLLQRGSAPELIEPARVAPPDTGSQLQLTVTVEDADAACSTLAERGVTLLNGPIDRPWGVRTAAFADPDGHVWEVAQNLQ